MIQTIAQMYWLANVRSSDFPVHTQLMHTGFGDNCAITHHGSTAWKQKAMAWKESLMKSHGDHLKDVVDAMITTNASAPSSGNTLTRATGKETKDDKS